jgi:hypothetical protein
MFNRSTAGKATRSSHRHTLPEDAIMQRRTTSLLSVLASAALLLQAAPVLADPPAHAKAWGYRSHEHRDARDDWHEYREHARQHAREDAGHQARYGNRDYQARRVYVVERLPRGYRTVNYRGDRYYYGDGLWNRDYGPGFVVAAPPARLIIDSRGVNGVVTARVPLVRW